MCPHTAIYTYRYAELERQKTAREADLTKTNEGLASRNGVIERQLIELKATYKGAQFSCLSSTKKYKH
jgi:DNA helicase HerA-like ATPase